MKAAAVGGGSGCKAAATLTRGTPFPTLGPAAGPARGAGIPLPGLSWPVVVGGGHYPH